MRIECYKCMHLMQVNEFVGLSKSASMHGMNEVIKFHAKCQLCGNEVEIQI